MSEARSARIDRGIVRNSAENGGIRCDKRVPAICRKCRMRHYKIAEPPRYYELSRVGRTVAQNKCRQTKEKFGTYTHERGGLPYITRDTTAAHNRSTASTEKRSLPLHL